MTYLVCNTTSDFWPLLIRAPHGGGNECELEAGARRNSVPGGRHRYTIDTGDARNCFDFRERDRKIPASLVIVLVYEVPLMMSRSSGNCRMPEVQAALTERLNLHASAPALGLSAADAAALLGVSESHFYNLHRTGRLGPLPVRMGRAVRWSRTELVSWFEAGSPPRHRWLAMRAANN